MQCKVIQQTSVYAEAAWLTKGVVSTLYVVKSLIALFINPEMDLEGWLLSYTE